MNNNQNMNQQLNNIQQESKKLAQQEQQNAAQLQQQQGSQKAQNMAQMEAQAAQELENMAQGVQNLQSQNGAGQQAPFGTEFASETDVQEVRRQNQQSQRNKK